MKKITLYRFKVLTELVEERTHQTIISINLPLTPFLPIPLPLPHLICPFKKHSPPISA